MGVEILVINQPQSRLKQIPLEQGVFLAETRNETAKSAGVELIFQAQSIIGKLPIAVKNAGGLPAAAALDNVAVHDPPRSAVVAEKGPVAQVLAVEERLEALVRHGI